MYDKNTNITGSIRLNHYEDHRKHFNFPPYEHSHIRTLTPSGGGFKVLDSHNISY